MMTNQDTPTPTRRQRRAIRIFEVFAVACWTIAIFAAKGHDLLRFGWPEWLCSGFISVIFDRWFPRAEV